MADTLLREPVAQQERLAPMQAWGRRWTFLITFEVIP